MATQAINIGGTSNPTDIANRIRTLFSKKLLAHVQETLVMDQFAQTEDLPMKAGGHTLRFFRRRAANRSNVVSLTEGTAISSFAEVTIGYVDVTLSQRGEAAKITDILQWLDMYNALQQNFEAMAEDAALDFDSITRNAIITGLLNTNSTYTGYFERFCGVANTGVSATDFSSLSGLSTSAGKITRAEALKCATQLRASKVPQLNGRYVAVVGPQVMHDIRQDTDWLAAATQSNPTALYRYQQVTLDGITYVETTNPMRETVYGTYAAAGDVYSTLFLGRGAYGCPKLSGTNSPYRPKIVIVDKPDKADPLNQYMIAGWKAFWNAVLLLTSGTGDIPYCAALRSKSTFA